MEKTTGSLLEVREVAQGAQAYKAMARALGERELGEWAYLQLEPGQTQARYDEETVYCVMAGLARVRCGLELAAVRAGTVLTIGAGASVEWAVEKALALRWQTRSSLEDRDRFRRALERAEQRPAAAARGSFVPLASPSPTLAALAPELRILYLATAPDAIHRVLFALVDGQTRVLVRDLAELGAYNALLEPYRSEARAWLALEAELGLAAAEELFVRADDAWVRWTGATEGVPLEETLRARLGLAAAVPGIDAGTAEGVLEVVLASLWGEDTPEFMFQYMTHPIRAPYGIGYLALSVPVSLSEEFRRRWEIEAVCVGEGGMPPPRRHVRVDLPRVIPEAGPFRCVADWAYGHEGASWSYTLERTAAGFRVVARSLLEQHD